MSICDHPKAPNVGACIANAHAVGEAKVFASSSAVIESVSICGDNLATYQSLEKVPDPWKILPTTVDPREILILTHHKWRMSPMYKRNVNGSPMVWWVGFDTDTCEQLLTHGHVSGMVRTDRTKVETNNSNRTLHEQAFLEIHHRYLLKHREGYRPAGEDPPAVGKPMLANKWIPDKTKLKYPVFVQPKLDGVRSLTRSEGGLITYRSRGNRRYPHLNSEFDDEIAVFLAYIPYVVEIDGEMYIHGIRFSELSSIFKNETHKHPRLPELVYYIFDFNCGEPLPYETRYDILSSALKRYNDDGHVNKRFAILYTGSADSAAKVKEYHTYFKSIGYEGTMIRKLAGTSPSAVDLKASLYKAGRGNNLLKYKDVMDEEGTVVGIQEASGTEAGAALLEVLDPRGNKIVMRPAFSFEERAEWFKKPAIVMGKVVTYEFQELSEYGVPRFPVVKAIRDYE